MDFLSLTTALVVVAISLLVIYVLYMSRQHGVFKRLSIPGPAPWPAVGNFPEAAKLGVFDFQRKYYDKHADHKVYGYFDPGVPLMVVRDLDLVREITIKHFNKFVNRRPFFTNEKPFDSALTFIKDDHWRNVRQTLSPSFSTGKLRRMCGHVESNSRVLVSNLQELCKTGTEVEVKDMISCFTLDVIASTGFGVNIDSLKDRSGPFATAAKKVMGFSGFVVSFVVLFPALVKVLIKLGWTAFDKGSVKFLNSFSDQAIQSRKEGHQTEKRNDFLQLMINAEKKEKEPQAALNGATNSESADFKALSYADIQGQALIFILASYDTVATVLSFGLFSIAHHPEVCTKLQEEVDTVLVGKSPNYDNVQGLVYLEQCLYEALRMYTPVIFVDRVCTQDCEIGGVRIPKGMVVMLPVYAIHRDSRHWPNPDKFDPDRFTPENKASRHPFAHMAFGHGPRNCIGMRLALLEMKLALASILQELTPVPCEKSVYPPKLSKYRMKAVDDLWVKMVSRKK